VLQSSGRPGVEDFATVYAGAGAYIDNPVGAADDIELVLDNEERVAGVFESVKRIQESIGVRGMKAGGGLVQDIDNAKEIRVQLGCEPDGSEVADRFARATSSILTAHTHRNRA